MDVCAAIGRQLFARYVSLKGWDWHPSRIEQAGLGFDSCGLTLAFAHSVPKSSLPLFWMGGRVKVKGKDIEWMPLFPNAL